MSNSTEIITSLNRRATKVEAAPEAVAKFIELAGDNRIKVVRGNATCWRKRGVVARFLVFPVGGKGFSDFYLTTVCVFSGRDYTQITRIQKGTLHDDGTSTTETLAEFKVEHPWTDEDDKNIGLDKVKL